MMSIGHTRPIDKFKSLVFACIRYDLIRGDYDDTYGLMVQENPSLIPIYQQNLTQSRNQNSLSASSGSFNETMMDPPYSIDSSNTITTIKTKGGILDDTTIPNVKFNKEPISSADQINNPGYISDKPFRSESQNIIHDSNIKGRPGSKKRKINNKPSVTAKKNRGTLGCLFKWGFAVLFVIVMISLCFTSFLIFQYYQIATELPDIQDLKDQASQFETTRILDRNGNILYEILDPTAGRRTYVPLEKISPYLIAATVATEDKGFYSHPGFDIVAIGRAFFQNYQSGGIESGASTITQQLARALLFSPQERVEQTYSRKIREAILAAEITRRYSKNEILELYLNEIYYGNLAYGIEAAAETYFGATANNLTLGQSAFLAGLPQAPAIYDVYTNPEIAFGRMDDVLVLIYELSQEDGCIFVSNTPQPVCVNPVMVTAAADEIRATKFESPDINIRYPHWVTYIRGLLESQFDAQTIYRSGFSVYTTLDPELQDIAQDIVRKTVDNLKVNGATGGALVAIRPDTGEILAMVGSPDYEDENSGQVNMVINPRQPGSAIKPLTYLAAFEKGWTPSTLIWDVPTEFTPSGQPDDPGPPYIPVNYDERFHGPVTVRSALANSYNIPAVKALEYVGIYDNPDTSYEDGLITLAKRLGITTLNRGDYGLSLTLGGGEVTLLELTNAYSILANSGYSVPPVAITKILDHTGRTLVEYQQPAGIQVVKPEHAYLISDILSDNEARSPAFGANSVLNLPFKVAAKTGTTNDFRDNWTIGYTPDIAVGVWVGNADYTPMQNTSGLTGAGPIWADFMLGATQIVTGNNPVPFSRPAGIVDREICAASGTEPSEWCPKQKTEIFVSNQPPLPKEDDLWKEALIDSWTGLKASLECSDYVREMFVLNVSDRWAKRWLNNNPNGEAWAESIGFKKPIPFAPARECKNDDPRPLLEFISPQDKETLRENSIGIYVQADASQWFKSIQLDYGLGADPEEWVTLMTQKRPSNQSDLLFEWNISELPQGTITLRLVMYSTEDTVAIKKIRLSLQVPTPTPTATPTSTTTSTPTSTITPTLVPTSTPIPTETPLIIPIFPTDTPVPSPTETEP